MNNKAQRTNKQQSFIFVKEDTILEVIEIPEIMRECFQRLMREGSNRGQLSQKEDLSSHPAIRFPKLSPQEHHRLCS
ncbi:hypothetical protein YC2023_061128 [Brassica napus]